ncbi:uncharacterized protein LOC126836375 isoform X2 [Adelges cooleyi]|uniref:uncharacterized protein LOC126836375 isoform X2 n=1 Tax=Adelges cooleyi TaxID=133065 RepID=UPI00217F8FC4|nr:uncharacterized protein LOC126836375 isoform X2 [Adelges cooleyi]
MFCHFLKIINANKRSVLVSYYKTILKENGKLKVNWSTLKNLPLLIRKEKIKELSKKHKVLSPNLKAQRLILKMGINEISRSIEKDQLACCVVAADVANSVIANYLIIMAATKKVPCVILPDMRLVTNRIIGFPSSALGLKTDVIQLKDNPLQRLSQIIIEFSKQFKHPYPNKIINKEQKTVKKRSKIHINVDDYLLKKPRVGRAFVPRTISSQQELSDPSFILIGKTCQEMQIDRGKGEFLSKDLLCIDTNPTEDMGEVVKRETKDCKQPLRYFALNMKKVKPNPDRKSKVKRIKTKIKNTN